MKIGVDIMGGDFAIEKTVHGAILALKELSKDTEIVLFGRKSVIICELKKHNISTDKFTIVDCPDVIEMDEHPTRAFKQKPNSSISKGLQFLARGEISGFASAGNTGAMFVAAFYSVGAITGVLRPAISSLIPREDGGVTILLDVGANADCKPDVLCQFGLLGSLFSKYVCGIKKPKVRLLNLGQEKTKGNLLTQATYKIMQQNTEFHFTGNIEGRDIFDSETDVIVCDGFTGNIVIKQAEGIFSIMQRRELLDDYFRRFNYENYGGTPILGLKRPVIIGHGISNEIAIKNMIILTKDVEKVKLHNKIQEILN